ncbi:hypothetical protein PC9H_010239 [Pleurotus ostreatus]|uniref:Uncharacterized protein n=1 Tax=Pleurotus ostreatus TaxID=5322 RepID=A0A8H6ZNE8_PLEOS|nr:uncharacterized protein PC9H_010239 [Pleurotus ostreatus]KAF7424928.1 hypothetical protein PC9H_010239 [Pleurotus ostreatus]
MPGHISSPNPGSGSDGCFATLSDILDEEGGVEGRRDKKSCCVHFGGGRRNKLPIPSDNIDRTRGAFPRIYIEAIRIRLRYRKGTREYEERQYIKETFALKVNDAPRDTVSWSWGDLDWCLQSHIGLRTGSRISLETCSDSEVLAAVSFEDIHKLANDLLRDAPWMASPLTVDFQERHVLATITLSFSVELQAPQTPTSFLPSMPVNLDKTLSSEPPTGVHRMGYGGAYGGYGGGYAGSSYDGRPSEYPAGIVPYASNSPYDFDSTPAKGTPYDFCNAAPVDTGKILYSVVGTKRPKPR